MRTDTVTFTYNGAGSVTARIENAVVGKFYGLTCYDPNSTTAQDEAVGPLVELTVDDIGGLGPGDEFDAEVTVNGSLGSDPFSFPLDLAGTGRFAIGNASGFAAELAGLVFDFDGTGIVEVSIPNSLLGETYSLFVADGGGGGMNVSGEAGTGGTLVLIVDFAPSPITGAYFVAYVYQDPFIRLGGRMFQAGEASAGYVSLYEASGDPADPFGLGRFYEAPPWRFVVTDLDGAILTWLDGLAFDRSVVFTRGQPTSISCSVPADNPEVNIVVTDGSLVDSPFVAEGDRLLYAFRRDGGLVPWVIHAAGLIQQLRDNADSDVSITQVVAFDGRQLLHRRPVTVDDFGTLPSDDFGVEYVSTPGSEIILEQLDRMEAWLTGEPLATAGLDWGQSGFYEGTIETTEAIDEITFARGVSIGEMIDTLEQTGTLDVVIRAVYDPANRPGITGELSIYERAGNEQFAAVFGYDCWPRSLVGIDRLTDGIERVNDLQFYAGQGGPPVTPYADANSIGRLGRYFAQQFFPGQVSVPAVEAMSLRTLALLANGQRTYTLNPAAERAPIPFTEYEIGDTVRVCARGAFREAIDEMLRVESLPIVIGDDQLERVNGLLVSQVAEAGS